jgi:uncharacterized protein YjeT (DUF2065 family)
MKTILYAFLLWVIFKGIAFLFFPAFMRNFISQNIIEQPIPQLKLFGGLLLICSAIIWIFLKKYYPL